MALRQAHEIGALIGVALFNHEVAALGVLPTDNRGSQGPRYNETSTIEILTRLGVRVEAARRQVVEEDEL